MTRRLAGGQQTRLDQDSFLRGLTFDRLADAFEAFESQWNELEVSPAAKRSALVTVVLPFRRQVEDHPEWRAPQELLAGRGGGGVVCLEPLDAFIAHRDKGLFNRGSAMHLSRAGHELLAEWLAERVRPFLIDEPPLPSLDSDPLPVASN